MNAVFFIRNTINVSEDVNVILMMEKREIDRNLLTHVYFIQLTNQKGII